MMNELLDKLKATSQNSGNVVGWLIGLLVLVLGTVAVAFLSYQLSKNGKELAKLKHEKDVAEEAKHQAEVASELLFLEERRKLAAEHAAEIEEEIAVMQEREVAFQVERDRLHQVIDRIQSWDDVDFKVR